MSAISDDALFSELHNDPAGMGYRNADGSWKTVVEIGLLLLQVGKFYEPHIRSRLTILAEQEEVSGHLDLKRLGQVLYGDDWLVRMYDEGEVDRDEVTRQIAAKKVAPDQLAKLEAIGKAKEESRLANIAARGVKTVDVSESRRAWGQFEKLKEQAERVPR